VRPRQGASFFGSAVKRQFTSFDDMLAQSETPVLVDMYAKWCGPCQLLGPVLEDIKASFGEKLTVVKVDTDKYPQLASRFNVAGLPTLLLFKKGEIVDRLEGLPQKDQLIQRLSYFLSN
jgi:thioredoxin